MKSDSQSADGREQFACDRRRWRIAALPLLHAAFEALSVTRREAVLLAVVAEPQDAYASLDAEDLGWFRLTPTARSAARLGAYAIIWRRSPKGKPWDEVAAALVAMGVPGQEAVAAARARLPPGLVKAIDSEPAGTRAVAGKKKRRPGS